MRIRLSLSPAVVARICGAALLTGFGGGGQGVVAQSQSPNKQSLDCVELQVLQGRVSSLDGNVLTLQTPASYPGTGGPGGHAQFVVAGRVFRIDVSHARVLLPDGERVDPLPLVVGERALIVVTKTASADGTASLIERLSQGERMVTH